jgi:adenylate cyclase
MFKYIILLIFLIATSYVSAKLQGQALIDSLEAELTNAKGDTNEVKLLNDLSYEYYRMNPDKGIEYGKNSLKLAKEIDFKIGETAAYIHLANNNIVKSDYNKALEYCERALKINEELDNKSSIAGIYYTMGNIYVSQSDYNKALEYFRKASNMYELLGDEIGIASSFSAMGAIYLNKSNYPKALENNNKALELFEILKNENGIAKSLSNIGLIYQRQSEYPKAIEYYNRALKIDEKRGNKRGIAIKLGNIGIIYKNQSDYPKALEYYSRALKINEEIGNKHALATNLGNIGVIYKSQSDYPKALEYYNRALRINQELGNKSHIALNLGNIGELYLSLSQDSVRINPNESNQYLSLNKDINLNSSIKYSLESIDIFKEIGELDLRSQVLGNLATAYKQRGDYKKAYEAHVEHKKLQDSVFNMDKSKEIATLTATREKEVAEKELEIQKLENIRQRNESYVLWGGLALFAIVMFVIYRQRKKSEKLLLNILPAAIAERLKKKEHPIADHFDNASVVFIDIVGFTKIASDRDSSQIVNFLNIIFTKFDEKATKYKLEKIKTIGDSYMAVTGVPLPDPEYAKNMAKFALEVKTEMHNYRTEDETLIQFRIGIDCGDVVAGVIGSKKFIYDLWGDTVNTASRMESNGTPDEIQVTERFKQTLENEFQFEGRGEMEIKGKGIMKTYYLKGKKNA